MSTTWFEKLTLGVAGLAALGIGLTITAMPHGFYATYGIELTGNPSLLNELRAPAVNLLAVGAIILTGAIRSNMTTLSAGLGATIFLAYALGRAVSMVADGLPHRGLVDAMIIEAVIGGLCLLAFLFRRGSHPRLPVAG